MTGTWLVFRSRRNTSGPDKPGQHEVEKDEIWGSRLEGRQRREAIGGRLDHESLLLKEELEGFPVGLLILDDEDPLPHGSTPSGARGRRMVKVDPTPTRDQTTTLPPCWRAMCLTMARPSPDPPASRVRASSVL